MLLFDDPSIVEAATDREETMLALGPHLGIDLDAMWIVAKKLQRHEAESARAVGSSRRAELAAAIAEDINELATAYKRLTAVVERMPSA